LLVVVNGAFVFMFARKLDLDKCGSDVAFHFSFCVLESVEFYFSITNVSPNGNFLKQAKYLLATHFAYFRLSLTSEEKQSVTP